MQKLRKAISLLVVTVMLLSLLPAMLMASANNGEIDRIEVKFDPALKIIHETEGSWIEVYNEKTQKDEEIFYYDIWSLIVNSNINATVFYKNNLSSNFNGNFWDVQDDIWDETGYDLQFDFSNQWDNPWGVGQNPVTFSLEGNFETTANIEIIENPVDSIEVSFDLDIKFVENTNGGMDERWNDDTKEWEDFFRYAIWNVFNRSEMTLTVNYKDSAKNKTYQGHFWNIEESIRNETGYEIKVHENQEQNPWGIGTHKVTFTLMGKSDDIEVEVIENPVDNIELSFDPVPQIIEYTGGYWDEKWNNETEKWEDYYSYYIHNFFRNSDVKLTINYKNNTQKIIEDNDYNDFYDKVYDETGYYIEYEDDQWQFPWNLGINKLKFTYMNRTFDVDFEVVKNPIKNIEISFDKIPQIIENTNGYMNSYWNDETQEDVKYFFYNNPFNWDGEWEYYDENEDEKPSLINYPFKTIITLTVNNEDGTKEEYSGIYEQLRQQFRDSGKEFHFEFDQNQYEAPWEIGVDNVGKFTYMGKTTQANFEIVETPVDKIEVNFVTTPKYIKEFDGEWAYEYDDEDNLISYFYYHVQSSKETMSFTVHYKDKTSKVYTGTIRQIIYAVYLDTWFGVGIDTEQNITAPWNVGTHTAAIFFLGKTADFDVEVVETPLESIEISFDTIPKLIENADGYWDWRDVPETDGEEEFYYYYLVEIFNRYNMTATVKYTDSTKNKVYTGNYVDVCDEIQEDTGYSLNINIDQYRNPLSLGINTVPFSFMKKTDTVNVEVIENPVDTIQATFNPALFVIENTDGIIDERWNPEKDSEEDFYRYNIWTIFSRSVMTFTVNYKDSSKNKTYTGTYDNIRDELLEDTGYWLEINDAQSQSITPWTVGTQTVTLSFMGKTTNAIEIEVVKPTSDVHTITATPSPTEGGTITGGNADNTYNNGATVALTATANEGYTFDGWYENNVKITNATEVYSFTATADRTLEARFTPPIPTTFTITTTVAPTESGMITGGNENNTYNSGENVVLTAIANANYAFEGWYENNVKIEDATEIYVFTATADRTLEARFVLAKHTVTLSRNITAGGTVSGAGTFDHGTRVTIRATPNIGYKFDGWFSGTTRVTSARDYSFDVTANRTFQARFSRIQYTVIARTTKGGKVSGGGRVNHNANTTVRATTNKGYTFDGWYQGNKRVSRNARYTFRVTSNLTLQARFKAIRVKSVKLSRRNATIRVRRSVTLRVTINPKTALDKKVTWRSSNPRIASVNSKGKVTAKKPGRVKITATTRDGKKKATANIRVR